MTIWRRSIQLAIPGQISEAFGAKRLRYLSWACQLEESSAPTEVPLDCPPSPCRRWWNPVAVLSDLRPNIQYHRGTAGDADDEDGSPNRRSFQCRRGGAVRITAVVDGQRFHGRGRTVKLAKRRLAGDVLRTLFNFRFIGQKPDSIRR